ncbi:MAG: RNA polymerase-associated protein RapA [Verrucomicrobia subdivision 3 bacterium]|nr:RNA polymerase-associated protein RapA [Limisphaerales bacterium]
MNRFREGQRWVSEPEPELGLGTVMQSGEGRVQVVFPATGEVRVYTVENAPLRRVSFRAGESIEDHEGNQRVIEGVREADDVLTYFGNGWEMAEVQLNDLISVHGPMERLRGGHTDATSVFALRRRALEMMHRFRKAPERGFLGGRIDLIPHQLFIAQEVGERLAPRVLLSDEVGLGKTIEAGLILHRQLVTGRASRVLILVPESLVHQWFVEMLRKFNVWVHIFDEARCASIAKTQPEANPFLDDQVILCSIDFLAAYPERAAQAKEAGWDLLVVDEAHHLEWSEENASNEYQLVEAIGQQAEGLLLLTATPEQLGQESHFARLRLLDPDRYSDFAAYQAEAEHFTDIAPIANALHAGEPLTDAQKQSLDAMPDLDSTMDADALLTALLDRHGPGRVIFRNARAAMSGFPGRVAHLAPLVPDRDAVDWMAHAAREFASDTDAGEPIEKYNLNYDPRIAWLGRLLHELGEDKVLLICRSREKALAIEKAVSRQVPVKTAVFHEGLNLVQRDRNAAWFAEEDGARLLICSEIGSEGRNFQFVHHLVLFDLPLNPELLEQRIGRLDRIGQTQTIHIHTPYLEGSPQEVLARWYHEGLEAFESNLHGANQLLQQFGDKVLALAADFSDSKKLDSLITQTAAEHRTLAEQLERGRDRLLELNSHRPHSANALVDAIRATDTDETLEGFMMRIFDHFGVHVEDLGNRTYLLDGRGVTTDSFPELPKEGLVGTFARSHALGREDVSLLSSDHPMVSGAVDLLLSSEQGNCSFGVWIDEEDKTLLLETIFVLEVLAPARLHADRFLPPTPVRILVNHKNESLDLELPVLAKGTPYKLLDHPTLGRKTIPAMIDAAEKFAEAEAQTITAVATAAMTQQLQSELDRLTHLRAVNDHVRPEEIALTRIQLAELTTALSQSRVRLDAVRLIWKGDPKAIRG